jgi:hypothetical protein
MTKLIVLAWIAGCANAPVATPPPAQPPTPPPAQPPTPGRYLSPRAEIPPVILPLLPRHGIYLAGGGLVSSAWRIIVDTDHKTIYGGTAKRNGAPSYGRMDSEATKPLTATEAARLAALADAAWRESPPDRLPEPTADYDEIMIVVDGDELFYLEGYGPIRRPVAIKAVAEVRFAAGI